LRRPPTNVQRFHQAHTLATGLGSVGIHREFITAATRWIMAAKAPRPIRFGDHGVVGNIDPVILKANPIMAAL
jgi:hypothetical protein